jgi:23S rRNA (adenine2030-N6)-methyltransferase
MNYRHAFHAGNFADVLKHAVLTRILVHLRGKPAPFRVIDTHAGAGIYDLAGAAAGRAGEWQGGIGRLLEHDPENACPGLDHQRVHARLPTRYGWIPVFGKDHAPPKKQERDDDSKKSHPAPATLADNARALLAPYLDVVRTLNSGDLLRVYPGSPALIRAFLRPQDRLIACEREPAASAALARHLAGDRRAKALAIDGWTALNAFVPPKERRGLVLIDPPYEGENEFARLAAALAAAHRKWASGCYLAWYPITARARPEPLARQLRASGFGKILRAELSVAPAREPPDAHAAALAACGVIAVNPPWTLAGELAILLPALAAVLSPSGGGTHRLDLLAGE